MKIKSAGHLFRTLFINLGIVILLYGPFILAYQLNLWIRQGFWTELPFSTFWFWAGGSYPSFSWSWMQEVAMFGFELPLSLIFSMTGLLVILLAAHRR
jgi:hypothetical protein